MFSTLNLRALLVSTIATLLLVASIIAGSRNFGNFDPALIAYLFACIFAFFGVVYRYSVWLQRPPTWRYFARGWELFFTGKFAVYGFELARHFVVNFLGQRFITRRGGDIGRGHLLMAWGCMLAFGVTFLLVFGWIHFGQSRPDTGMYEIREPLKTPFFRKNRRPGTELVSECPEFLFSSYFSRSNPGEFLPEQCSLSACFRRVTYARRHRASPSRSICSNRTRL